jgi:hypothetical protein
VKIRNTQRVFVAWEVKSAALSNPALLNAPSKKLISALHRACGDRNGWVLDCGRHLDIGEFDAEVIRFGADHYVEIDEAPSRHQNFHFSCISDEHN